MSGIGVIVRSLEDSERLLVFVVPFCFYIRFRNVATVSPIIKNLASRLRRTTVSRSSNSSDDRSIDCFLTITAGNEKSWILIFALVLGR